MLPHATKLSAERMPKHSSNSVCAELRSLSPDKRPSHQLTSQPRSRLTMTNPSSMSDSAIWHSLRIGKGQSAASPPEMPVTRQLTDCCPRVQGASGPHGLHYRERSWYSSRGLHPCGRANLPKDGAWQSTWPRAVQSSLVRKRHEWIRRRSGGCY